MATFRRLVVPGATYFFTINTYHRMRVLTDSPFYMALKDALRWNLVKRIVSQATRHLIESPLSRSRQQRRELGLWQRRFWEHQIRDEQDVVKHVEYSHWNPVKHGCVAHVRDWPYSSFHRYVKQGLYPKDWADGGNTSDTGEDYGESL